ncbi:MAG: ABC transporter permease [Syntrophorhabdaceae bacterium]
MLRRIKYMVIKEFIQIFRDKKMKPIIFVTPVLQLIVFGYAVTMDVSNIRTAVYDLDKTSVTREIARRFEASGYFRIVAYPRSDEEVRKILDKGDATVVLSFDHGFTSDLEARRKPALQILLDGTDSNTAQVASGYATGIVHRFSQDIMMKPAYQAHASVEVRPRAWYNADLKSKNYNVPGVIAIMVLLVCLLLTAMAVVREREIGTMEQLMVTPIRPAELILGKTIPFAVIGLFDMFLVTLVGTIWFDVPIRGSIPLLSVATAVYLLSVLGFGLFISTISRTQQQAMMASFLFFAPAVLLSGLMFPIENMPFPVQLITYLNPLRYFLIIIRGIFLKGSGIGILWPQFLALFILGVSVVAMSSLRFKKRLN